MKGAMAWPFLRLYILTLMFFSANAILNVFIPLRGHDLGATNTVIGIVMGAYMLTAMVFRPWAGQIIARVGPIKVLRIILIINAIALIIYGFTGLEGYFVARVMQGVCTAFFSMSLQLGIIDALPEEHRSEGVSLYSLFSTIPNLIGPLVAVGIWNANNISLFAIVIIFIALTTTFFGYRVTFAEQEPDTSDKIEKMPFNAVTVFAQFFKNKELLNSGIIMIVASIVFGAVSTFVPLYTVSLGFANAGIFLTIQAIEFLNKPPSAWVILAKPNLGISSPDIFKLINLDKRYDVHTKMCYEALENRDYQQLCQSLSNRLEPISVSKHPQIDKLKNNMLKSGADGALMSGSGPTVYGLARKESQAKNIYNAVNGCCNEVYLVRLLG